MAQPGLTNPNTFAIKPSLSQEINWNNPISKGLEFCVPFNLLNTNNYKEYVSGVIGPLGNVASPGIAYQGEIPTTSILQIPSVSSNYGVVYPTKAAGNATAVVTPATQDGNSSLSASRIRTIRVTLSLRNLASDQQIGAVNSTSATNSIFARNSTATMHCILSKGNAGPMTGTATIVGVQDNTIPTVNVSNPSYTNIFLGVYGTTNNNSSIPFMCVMFGAQDNGNNTFNPNFSKINIPSGLGISTFENIDLVIINRQNAGGGEAHEWWVNGTLVNTINNRTAISSPVAGNTLPIVIGGYPTTTGAVSTTDPVSIIGKIDNVMLWSRALSPTEVPLLYRSPYEMFK